MTQDLLQQKQNHNHFQIAYFSMEIGLEDSMKTYCGGLGILAGDTIKSATDLGIHMIGVTLLYKKGWLKQVLDKEQGQIEEEDPWDYAQKLTLLPETFSIQICNETVHVQIWQYVLKGEDNNVNLIYFLDTDLEQNSQINRELSQKIYPTNQDVWLRQEVLLGIGGFEALQVLGYHSIENYHLNESHAASLVLALRSQYENWDDVRQKLSFTTHTPLASAHQQVAREELQKYLPTQYFDLVPANLWQRDMLNYTTLCIFASKFSNSVAKRHMEVTQKMYPQYPIEHITNGSHPSFWTSRHMAKVFDKHVPHWKTHPDHLRQILKVDPSEIRQAHQQSKQELIDVINSYGGSFKPNIFTIGFARRAVAYKRASFIFTMPERLREVAKKYGGIQLVFAGKAYPTDEKGKLMIAEILQQESTDDLKIIYLPNYHISLAQKMVSGVDLWLNNPIPPLEASGTSGMKASMNGIPNFSILDGWWPEGWIEDQTGWSIGQDLCEGDFCSLLEVNDLYTKLESKILPTFYNNPQRWSEIQRNCIAINGSYFNTHRMLQEYIAKSYI